MKLLEKQEYCDLCGKPCDLPDECCVCGKLCCDSCCGENPENNDICCNQCITVSLYDYNRSIIAYNEIRLNLINKYDNFVAFIKETYELHDAQKAREILISKIEGEKK